MTSLPDGERLASKPGTRAYERDGRSVPTWVTPSPTDFVGGPPPSMREVKGRSPEKTARRAVERPGFPDRNVFEEGEGCGKGE